MKEAKVTEQLVWETLLVKIATNLLSVAFIDYKALPVMH